jgi:CrcB protein
VEREQTIDSGAVGRGARRSLPQLDRGELAAVFAGGFIGTLARAALAQGISAQPGSWPWPTFAVNVAGAFLLGYLLARSTGRAPSTRRRRLFLGSGVCGALTTFSTMMVELLKMLDEARWGLAAGYGSASIACGLGAAVLATSAARRARTGR